MTKNAFEELSARIKTEIAEKSLVRPGENVLVAFSGGADSTALLLLLSEIGRVGRFGVAAAHYNHGIRGAEADRDEEFCRAICESRGIPFFAGHGDVPAEAEKTGEGIEECARRLRYDFLEATALVSDCAKIATAHHADDNIETVLLHLIRGSGLRGLCGIPEQRGKIIRPLLGVGRREIVEALDSIGQDYVTDGTNSDLEMSRNLLRHKVLPELYRINPCADRAFLGMCRSVSEDEKYLTAESLKIPDSADMETLAKLPEALLTRFVRRKYEAFFGGKEHPSLGHGHVSTVVGHIKNGKGTVRYPLPGDTLAYLSSSGLEIRSVRENDAGGLPEGFSAVLRPGENVFSEYGFTVYITFEKNVANELKNIYKLSIPASVSSDKILNGNVGIRSRTSSDGYRFGGFMRTVSRQLIRFKIPEYKRKALPVFTSDGEAFWVPGLPVSDDLRVVKGGSEAYIVYCPSGAFAPDGSDK